MQLRCQTDPSAFRPLAHVACGHNEARFPILGIRRLRQRNTCAPHPASRLPAKLIAPPRLISVSSSSPSILGKRGTDEMCRRQTRATTWPRPSRVSAEITTRTPEILCTARVASGRSPAEESTECPAMRARKPARRPARFVETSARAERTAHEKMISTVTPSNKMRLPEQSEDGVVCDARAGVAAGPFQPETRRALYPQREQVLKRSNCELPTDLSHTRREGNPPNGGRWVFFCDQLTADDEEKKRTPTSFQPLRQHTTCDYFLEPHAPPSTSFPAPRLRARRPSLSTRRRHLSLRSQPWSWLICSLC
jgi:hypothetical protein